LNIRYSVIDEKGKEIKNSRDINLLQKELANTINTTAMDNIRRDWEKEGITRWDFGELPTQIPLTGIHGLIGYAYPALNFIDDSINLRLFSDQKESATNHTKGVAALYEIYFADVLKQLRKNVALNARMKAIAANVGNPKQLEQSIINRVKKDLFLKPWRKQEDFIEHADSLNSKILPYGQQVLTSIAPVLKAFDDTLTCVHNLMKKNTGNNPALKFLQDIRTELKGLVPIDFPGLYTFDRMKDLPRYSKALALRAERGSLNLASAQNKMQQIEIYSKKLQQILSGGNLPLPSLDSHGALQGKAGRGRVSNERNNTKLVQPIPKDSTDPKHIGIQQISRFKDDISVDYPEEKKKLIEELFWMIEEYKVSLFAQELKTPYPVSPKKINQLIEEIEKL
jgi:ATP-dependent helicase HrpA